jgi:hypothetical protein
MKSKNESAKEVIICMDDTKVMPTTEIDRIIKKLMK